LLSVSFRLAKFAPLRFFVINPAVEKLPFSLTCHAKGRKASYWPYGQLRKNRSEALLIDMLPVGAESG
jgi:hypothetical protein